MAPDYVLIQEDSEDKFVEACKEQCVFILFLCLLETSDIFTSPPSVPPHPPRLAEFYPSGALTSDSFGRIISTNHFLRIKSLMDNTKGEVVYGGKTDETQKFIEPTLVKGIKGDDSLMRECVSSFPVSLFALVPLHCQHPLRFLGSGVVMFAS